jgi:hypothetical protein
MTPYEIRLVINKSESGGDYTPRAVVAFMCREALKGYLAGAGRPLPAGGGVAGRGAGTGRAGKYKLCKRCSRLLDQTKQKNLRRYRVEPKQSSF